MRKKLKTLLCASALLASFYSGCIYAADNIIIDTEDYKVTEGQQSFQDIEVIAPGKLTISNGAIVACDNLHNGNQVNNFGKIAPSQLDNQGEITNNLTVIINSNITNNDTINNFGNIEARALENHGTISSSGNLTIHSGTNYNKIEQKDITFKGNFTNDKTLISTGTFTNNHVISGGNNSELTVKDGSNSGSIMQNKITISAGNTSANGFVNSNSIISNIIENNGVLTNEENATITVNNETKNNGNITNNGSFTTKSLTNVNGATISGDKGTLSFEQGENQGSISQAIINKTGDTTFTNKGQITAGQFNITSGTLENSGNIGNEQTPISKVINSATLNNEKDATIDVSANGAKLVNVGTVNNNGTVKFSDVSAGLENSGSFITNGGLVQDAIVANTGRLTATNGAKLYLISLNNTNGIVNILNSSDLDLSNQIGDLNGTINVAGGRADANGNLIANTITSQINDTKFVGNLNVGDGVSNSTLSMSNILVDKTANLNIAHGGLLVVGNNSTVNLDDNTKDIVNGDIQLLQDGTLNLQDYTLATGNSSTQKNGNQAYYSQSGGVLNLNNSTLKLGDSSAVTGGILNLDSTSQFLVTSEANGTANTFLESMTMADGSRFGAMNL